MVGDTILTPGQKVTYIGNDVFTYDILLADSPKYQAVDKGVTNQKEFSVLFDSFPWKKQMELAEKLKVQSATISVHDQLRKTTLWISPTTNPETEGMGYILGITRSVPNSIKDATNLNASADSEQIHILIKKFFDRDPTVQDFLMTIKN